jgi:hypothetical protein
MQVAARLACSPAIAPPGLLAYIAAISHAGVKL